MKLNLSTDIFISDQTKKLRMLILKRFLGLAVLLTATITTAQQLPQFTQYVYNTMSVNPAYAGSRETLNATALHRNQWAGLEGNPTTSTLSVHAPLRYSRVGVGLTYINDNLGDESTNYVYGNVSYTVPLSQKVNLSFGLNAGFTNYALNIPDINDPFFEANFSQWNPNFGAGVYLSSRMWYIGISSPRLLNTDLNKGEFAAIERNSYYTIGGVVFDIAEGTKFKTTAIAKFTNGAPATYDITANFLFYDKFWIGASYRFNDADNIGILTDYQVSNAFRVGYAYDLPTSDIKPYTGGTHEIILIYELPIKKLGGAKSPRYF
jgi:type IX secretion system PorP/SprF family membrane protein